MIDLLKRKRKSAEYLQAAYSLQKLVGVEVIPAEEAARVFSRVLEELTGNDAIVNGIRETVAIKLEGLYESIRDLREEIVAITADLSASCDNSEQLFERASQAVATFTKNAVLHEICTFEEILTHSVPRMDNAPAAAVLLAAYDELATILRKNGIESIRPAPHDAWNAREHEVLLAEEAEGFAKGEIIKCVGTGYRRSADVLVRANVIAAK
jgi:molecular chaperone GrpE (heat shock protein)